MIKLTATHLAILAAAAGHENSFLVRPDALRPAGAAKIAARLIELGLVRELRAKSDMPLWREDELGRAFCLKILKAGREAVLAMMPAAAEGRGPPPPCEVAQTSDAILIGAVAQTPQMPMVIAARLGSKRALIFALLTRDDGASIHTLMEATGWLPHTTRAVLSGLRKGGLNIARTTDGEGGASIYRIKPADEAAAC